jgi:hypothetical protein
VIFNQINRLVDDFFGRGRSAIVVPVMDGALKQNQLLDQAEVICQLNHADDLAVMGHQLFLSSANNLYLLKDQNRQLLHSFKNEITALAAFEPGQLLAVALDGQSIEIFDLSRQTSFDNTFQKPVAQLEQIDKQGFVSINSIGFHPADGSLVFTDGSKQQAYRNWCHDLMNKGTTGRVGRWNWQQTSAEWIRQDLQYAFGAMFHQGELLLSESWSHRIINSQGQPVITELVGYPSRMSQAGDGGFWLTCFACRSQLVEFVLKEKQFRKKMIEEIDPRYWIAPMLSSGQDFLEPLQGAGVKSMGVLKPWAPPRSYGLVMHFDAQARLTGSLHSRVDGHHHGITAAVEQDGYLYMASKGSGRVLRYKLDDPEFLK